MLQIFTILNFVLVTFAQEIFQPFFNISHISSLDNYYWDYGDNSSRYSISQLPNQAANGIFFDNRVRETGYGEGEEIFFDDDGQKENDEDGLTDTETQVYDSKAKAIYSCPSCRCGLRFRNRIVGGSFARKFEFPWMGFLVLRNFGLTCGGSVINDLYLATAAHCVVDTPIRNLAVRLMDFIRSTLTDSPSFTVRLRRAFIHRRYNARTENYDIALLKFRKRLSFESYVRPICLPVGDKNFANARGLIAGWGGTAQSEVSDRLKRAVVNIFPDRVCRRTRIGRQFTRNMMCGGYIRGGVDACQGDSGGPLMALQGQRYVLAGITSWGIGCALPNAPGVYTRTTRFLRWIYRRTRDACYCSRN